MNWSFLLTLLASTFGGGAVGALLTHLRLSPKSKAEAREITAAAIDKDWSRFEREINRLVKRVEAAEDAADKAIAGQRACEEREVRRSAEAARREAEMAAEILRLKAVNDAQGEIRARAAGIVAADRLQARGEG